MNFFIVQLNSNAVDYLSLLEARNLHARLWQVEDFIKYVERVITFVKGL